MFANSPALQILLSVLSGVGLYTCFAFAYGEYQHRRGNASAATVVCKDGSCINLSHTFYGRLLGFPNWYIGLVFYTLLILTAWISWTPLFYLALAGSVLSVLTSIFLIYALVKVLKATCINCYTAHAVNGAVFVIFITTLLS